MHMAHCTCSAPSARKLAGAVLCQWSFLFWYLYFGFVIFSRWGAKSQIGEKILKHSNFLQKPKKKLIGVLQLEERKPYIFCSLNRGTWDAHKNIRRLDTLFVQSHSLPSVLPHRHGSTRQISKCSVTIWNASTMWRPVNVLSVFVTKKFCSALQCKGTISRGRGQDLSAHLM